MAECSYARCQQERRAIRRDLQRWTKNMVHVLGLERVAEELMGRRKWKLYQDALLPQRERGASEGSEAARDGAGSEGEEREERAMPAAEQAPPALKIKTIEQINTAREENSMTLQEGGTKPSEASPRTETILESLIKRPVTQPRLMPDELDWRPSGATCVSHRRRTLSGSTPGVGRTDEPQDWRPAERCYFCPSEPAAGAAGAAGAAERSPGGGTAGRTEGGAASPAVSESSSSSVSGARSPAAAAAAAPPALLAHLLQLQNHSPQAIAQFQQMMAALAALGSGLMPQAALSQAWILQRLQQNQILQQQQHVDRITADIGEKVSVSNCSPSFGSGAAGASAAEQPLDLSARSGSSTGDPATPPPGDAKLPSRVPPIDPKFLANVRLKRPADGATAGGAARRAYTDDELQSALRDIQSGRLGTRRAALLYGIPRSTLRNKVYKMAVDHAADGDGDSADRDSADDDDPDAIYRTLQEEAPGVILKIPTFPAPEREETPPRAPPELYAPLAYPSPHAPGETLFSLRDVIAKSISQKFQQPPPDPEPYRAPERRISVIKQPDAPRYPHANAGNSRAGNGAPAPPGGKGTRPKRGKYRNYDRDSLVEAVKAVQRGEMSVHRAGSYYGVPHSTLEYKVKERHLMRPRKREPKPPQPEAKPSPPAAKPHAKPGFSNGLNGPESLGGGGGYPPGYPFWSHGGGFPALAGGTYAPGGDMFASHMMQRLREESAPPPPNGSFLEGIIRSSLERPAPGALLQRLTAEPQPPQPPLVAPRADFEPKANASLLQRLRAEAPAPADGGSPPPARRPRLSSSDRQLAVEMRETVQRLRAEKMRVGRNGTPTPPAAAPPAADRA